MNTPPAQFYLPELDVRELDTKLREVTPEIDFPRELAHSNKWSAELAAHGLKAAEIYHERHTICDKSYWQIETLALVEVYLQQSTNDGSELERWRSICVGIGSLLKQQGVDLEKQRQSIDNEDYWKLEADCLKRYAARLENELVDEVLANSNPRHPKLPSPCSKIERRRKHQPRYQRQSRVSRPQNRNRKVGGCHGMTLRSAKAEVLKRRDVVGGKAHQS